MPSSSEYIVASLEATGLSKEDSFLLACSGGRDSMLLLKRLHELEFKLLVAHANFQLRGAASDEDESFLAAECEKLQMTFLSKRFDTRKEVQESGESTQMVARRLRYEWLQDLMMEEGASRIITAHHQRDQAETVLLNLMRGTGVRGLQGMVADTGIIWRPWLELEYDQILRESEGLAFREDKSNTEVKYKRNFIRHGVLKSWEEQYPGTIRQIGRSAELVQESNAFLEDALSVVTDPYLSHENESLKIHKSIGNHDHARILMRYILEPFGLMDEAAFILEKTSGPGAMFSSATHRLLVDREYYWIEEKPERVDVDSVELHAKGNITLFGKQFHLSDLDEVLVLQPQNAFWIPKQTKLPLILRAWRQGDRMQPFGMPGSKLISDLFTDAKWTVFQKEQAVVITDATGNILAVPGLRNSELCRVSIGEQAYQLNYKDHE